MVEWDVQIERLKDKAESVTALQLKRDLVAEKLHGIAMASDHEWEDMKDGAE